MLNIQYCKDCADHVYMVHTSMYGTLMSLHTNFKIYLESGAICDTTVLAGQILSLCSTLFLSARWMIRSFTVAGLRISVKSLTEVWTAECEFFIAKPSLFAINQALNCIAMVDS